MARDPRSRHELKRKLEEALGQEAADTLMEALPPHPWDELATKADVALLRTDVEALRADVGVLKSDVGVLKSDVGALKSDVGALKSDVTLLRRDVERLEERFELKLEAMGHQLIGAFRGELNAAITGQTRAILVSMVGMALSTGSLVLAAAQLS